MLLIIFLQLLIPVFLLWLLFYLRRRLHWKLLRRYNSQISGFIDVLEKYNGEKVLRTNYFVQGVSIEKPSIQKSYWYAVAQAILNHCRGRKNPRILFIGLGANTSSLLIHQKDTRIHQVIVEIDPLVVKACEEYFDLASLTNSEIIVSDIFAQLAKKKSVWKDSFDVIVIDTFTAKPPYLMKGSHDPAFLNELLFCLHKDGMFLFNIPVKTRGIHVPELLSYLDKTFAKTEHNVIKDPRGYRNHFISAKNKKS